MNTLDLTDLKVIAARDLEPPARTALPNCCSAKAPSSPPRRGTALGQVQGHRRRRPAASRRSGQSGAATPQVVARLWRHRQAGAGGQSRGPRPVLLARSRGDQGRDHRRRPEALAPAVRGRQRRQISYRIGPNEVICTPTLISKADLRPEDLCMVDLEGNQLVGSRPRTSEILLHLEIYKAVSAGQGRGALPPAARHRLCHHRARAALLRSFPSTTSSSAACAVSPYETPGTQKFAETVIPYVQHHNTVLLANHGIVCWADTVTHAEWFAEVVETYCWTLMIAAPARRADHADSRRQGGGPARHQEEARAARRPLHAGMPALRSAGPARAPLRCAPPQPCLPAHRRPSTIRTRSASSSRSPTP